MQKQSLKQAIIALRMDVAGIYKLAVMLKQHTMKKVLYILITCIIIFSCEKKGNLELILLNKEITSLKNVETDNFKLYEKDYFNNKIYDSLSRNILHFKLVNNASKKYFIVLNENFLNTLENDYYLKISSNEKRNYKRNALCFNFFKNDSILSGQITLLSACGIYSKCSPASFQYSLDSLYIENLKKSEQYDTKYVGLQNKDLLENSFIISPGESKYFTSIVNLPLRKNGEHWLSHVDSIEPNLASLSLINNEKYIISLLSKDQKKNIKENGCVIYNGMITSNKVPVRLVKMPKIE